MTESAERADPRHDVHPDNGEPAAGDLGPPPTAEKLAALLDEAQELLLAAPTQAEPMLRRHVQSATVLGLPALVGRGKYLLARVATESGKFDDALDLIASAKQAWRSAGEPAQALRTDLGKMQILDDLGRHGEALAVGQDLLRDLDAYGTDPLTGWIRSAALENVGVALSFVGDHEQALASYAAAESGYQEMGSEDDLARATANRGIELVTLGRAREGVAVLDEARGLLLGLGNELQYAKLAANLGGGLIMLGEMRQALDVLHAGRSEVRRLGAGAEEPRLTQALAEAYLMAGLHNEALTEATQARESAAAIGLKPEEAVATLIMANAQLALGATRAADQLLDRAAILFESVGNRRALTRTWLSRAQVAAASGAGDKANRWARRAKQAALLGGWTVLFVDATLLLAEIDPGQHESSVAEASEAAVALQLPYIDLAIALARARYFRTAGTVAEWESALRHAADLSERRETDVPDLHARVAVRTRAVSPHDQLVGLLVSQNRLVEAAAIADRARSQTLRELVARAGTTANRLDAGESGALTRLYEDLGAGYALLAADIAPSRRRYIEQRARELEQQINITRLGMARDDAGAAGRTTGMADRTTLQRPPTLAFHVVDDDLVAFVITAGHVEARRTTDVRRTLSRLQRDLARQWSRVRSAERIGRADDPQLVSASTSILEAIYRLTIAPVSGILSEVVDDHLVVVPHRALHQVPFQALWSEAGPLHERWATTITPTVGIGPGAPRMLDRAALNAMLTLSAADSDAPAVQAEAAALQELAPNGTHLTGPAATSVRLFAEAGGRPVVHIAAHGQYRASSPLFSSLRLADRWVTASELTGLDLRQSVVTLSACESGRTDSTSAEPVGLSWAFLAAGASDTIVSMWRVDDATTATLMADFYAAVADGTDIAQALRHAQLVTARTHPHPYYWAPFVRVASSEPRVTAPPTT